MITWDFTLAIDTRAVDPDFDWYNHYDCIVGIRWKNRVLLIEYGMPAESLQKAVDTLRGNIELIGGKVLRLEPDDLVTLPEIGNESGLDWGRIHSFANSNEDDPMPLPVRCITSEKPLWSWREVSAWLAERNLIGNDVAKFAELAYNVNLSLKTPCDKRSNSSFDLRENKLVTPA